MDLRLDLHKEQRDTMPYYRKRISQRGRIIEKHKILIDSIKDLFHILSSIIVFTAYVGQ